MSAALEILRMVLDLHDAHGRMDDFHDYTALVERVEGRLRAVQSGRAGPDAMRGLLDQFQDSRTMAVLRRARDVESRFGRFARTPLALPRNELNDALESIEIATADYGARSREQSDAIQDFVRLYGELQEQRADIQDHCGSYSDRLWAMRDYYRLLAQRLERITTAFGEALDSAALRQMGDFADAVRTDLFLAYQAFDELSSLCRRIVLEAERGRARLSELSAQCFQYDEDLRRIGLEASRRYHISL